MRKYFIAGNWKMNMTVSESVAFAAAIKDAVGNPENVEIGVFPTSLAVKSVADTLAGSNILVGAQNMLWEDSGAYTGEVSADMVLDTGATCILIGHSERRQYYGETDETVNKKLVKALEKGLRPVVCCGENLDEREAGNAEAVVKTQITGGLAGISKEDAAKVTIAYEPVWAIGTGKTATPEMAQEIHAAIRGILADMFDADIADQIQIQYGGSVKPENVKELMAQADIDGALVGGAALKVDSFKALVNFQG